MESKHQLQSPEESKPTTLLLEMTPEAAAKLRQLFSDAQKKGEPFEVAGIPISQIKLAKEDEAESVPDTSNQNVSQ